VIYVLVLVAVLVVAGCAFAIGAGSSIVLTTQTEVTRQMDKDDTTIEEVLLGAEKPKKPGEKLK